jgi:methionyl-tRNA formyltransferase
LNIIFAGTPDIAATCLQALLNSEHNVVAVYTQPDRPKGRGKKLQPSPVKVLAMKHNISVEQPERLQTLGDYEADVMVVVAYGLLLPENVLQTPQHGCINVHASLLPKYRGAAPVQHSILNGDAETGISIMQMDAGMDTGPILQQASCTIEAHDTSETLLAKLALLGSETLLSTLEKFDSIKAVPQNNALASYAHKIKKQDAKIDWSKPAIEIALAIRAYQPWPVAFSDIFDMRVRFFDGQAVPSDRPQNPGEILAINHDNLDIACGDGLLRVSLLQLPGKKVMPLQEILNGHPELFTPGMHFQ